jgi:hypothetical protein
VLHILYSVGDPGQFVPVRQTRVLVMTPPPQDLEHGPNGNHSVHIGQDSVLQGTNSLPDPGQSRMSPMQKRCRDLNPPPQDTEHCPNASHSDHMLQNCVLQATVSLADPVQSAPMQLRVLVLSPPPHEREHDPNASHSDQAPATEVERHKRSQSVQ